MKKLSRSSPKWINEALKLNVRFYINAGVDLLREQKVYFSFEPENIANLTIFINVLYEICLKYKTLVDWELYISDKPDYFKENIIKVTPLNMVKRVKEMLKYDKPESR